MEAAVLWQRSEGRTRVFQGEDPDVILAEVNAKIAEAREQFKGKLERLLAWAKGEGGQPPDSSASSSGSGQPHSD